MSIRSLPVRPRLGWTGTCAVPHLDGSMADATLWSHDCYGTGANGAGSPSTAGATSPAVIVPLPSTGSYGEQLVQNADGSLSYVLPAGGPDYAHPDAPPAPAPVNAGPVLSPNGPGIVAPGNPAGILTPAGTTSFAFPAVPWYYWAGGAVAALFVFGRK